MYASQSQCSESLHVFCRYKVIQDNKTRTGAEATKWDYLNEMDELLGNKACAVSLRSCISTVPTLPAESQPKRKKRQSEAPFWFSEAHSSMMKEQK